MSNHHVEETRGRGEENPSPEMKRDTPRPSPRSISCPEHCTRCCSPRSCRSRVQGATSESWFRAQGRKKDHSCPEIDFSSIFYLVSHRNGG